MKTSEFMVEANKRIPEYIAQSIKQMPPTAGHLHTRDDKWYFMLEKWGDGHPTLPAAEFHITYDPSTTTRRKKFGLWGHKFITGDWEIGKPYRMW